MSSLPVLKFVDKLGVELEGGWNRKFKDIRIGNDISVVAPPNTSGRPCSCSRSHDNTRTCHWGEIPSPPLPLDEMLSWTKAHYPDGINNSCGLHIHVSVKKPLYYAQLMDVRFFNLFLSRYKEWGKRENLPPDHVFWERVNNKSQSVAPAKFCNRPFAAIRQAALMQKDDVRRSPLNYCYAQHGTLECRLFPAFEDYQMANRAVLFFATLVEEWLTTRPKEKREVIRHRIGQLAEAREPFKELIV